MLWEVANEMDAEDGLIWVYGPDDDGVMAFTDFGIETLTGIIEMMRAIILRGEWPDALAYAISLVVSLLIFYAGRTLFMRKKTILVDII